MLTVAGSVLVGEDRVDIASAVEHPDDFGRFADQSIEDDMRACRDRPDAGAQFIACAAAERVSL